MISHVPNIQSSYLKIKKVKIPNQSVVHSALDYAT